MFIRNFFFNQILVIYLNNKIYLIKIKIKNKYFKDSYYTYIFILKILFVLMSKFKIFKNKNILYQVIFYIILIVNY
jgi:hypothetical protein